MIQTVLKRDGRIAGFNREKIAAAIRKAMLTTEAVAIATRGVLLSPTARSMEEQ